MGWGFLGLTVVKSSWRVLHYKTTKALSMYNIIEKISQGSPVRQEWAGVWN